MNNKNILLIFADELRADALGCYGNTVCQTPNLDRLATMGTLFDQCMVTQPTCTPCRASLLTGCYPSALRSRMVGCTTPDDPRFLPRVLRSNGYRTASIGKIHLASQAKEPQLVAGAADGTGELDYYGFQHVDLVNGHGMNCFGNQYTLWLREQVPNCDELKSSAPKLSPGVNSNAGAPKTVAWTLPAEVHSGEYIATRTEAYLRDAAATDQPFFLHVSFPDPHHPFTIPEPYASMYSPDAMAAPLPAVSEENGATELQLETHSGKGAYFCKERRCDHLIGTPPDDYRRYTVRDWQVTKAIYYGMISLLDQQIGRIMTTLKETGLDRNTIVVFVSDHGDYLGDHGMCGKGFHYDSVIRTPLIVVGPEIQEKQRLDGVASVVDIAPTLLDLVGVTEPDALQGVSMRGALTGNGQLPRDAVMTENDDDFVPMRMRTLTTRGWKLTVYAGSEDGELYDRKNDPDELINLWKKPDYVDVKTRLQVALGDHVLCAIDGANGRTQQPAPPIPKILPRALEKDL